jgi:choline monooxygenase
MAFNAASRLETATALDSHFYTQPIWSAFERNHVFRRSWQYAAHIGELSAKGDHVVTEIAGQPLIIVRQVDGDIRAFHNVCRHRAGPLASCSGRGASRLRCMYHGWQYGLDGHLLAAPEMGEAEGFDKSSISLPEVALAVWQGLVFVALDPATPHFDKVFAGISDRILPQDPSALTFYRHDRYDVACNWKVYVDNYAEGYHLPYVHPALTQTVDYSDYQSELADYYSLQVSPITAPGGPYGDGTAFYYLIYPNLMLNFVPGRLQLNRVLPTGQDSCSVDFIWFYADDPDVVARATDDIAFTNQVQAEDAAICEQVQRGLASGSYVPGRISPKREAGLWHFQNLLREEYANGSGES